jgi:hypothetical protein
MNDGLSYFYLHAVDHDHGYETSMAGRSFDAFAFCLLFVSELKNSEQPIIPSTAMFSDGLPACVASVNRCPRKIFELHNYASCRPFADIYKKSIPLDGAHVQKSVAYSQDSQPLHHVLPANMLLCRGAHSQSCSRPAFLFSSCSHSSQLFSSSRSPVPTQDAGAYAFHPAHTFTPCSALSLA